MSQNAYNFDDIFETLSGDPAQVSSTPVLTKLKSNKKNKKKNGVSALAEQFDQEKTPKPVKNEGYSVPGQQELFRQADTSKLSTQSSPGMPAPQSSHPFTSPVFAALGDAFRNTQRSPQQEEDVDDVVDEYSTSPPQRSHLVNNNVDAVATIPTSQTRALPASTAADEIRGGFSHHSPPIASPRPAYRQTSRRPSGYQHQTEYLATSPRGRPVSMPANMFHLPSPSTFKLRSTSRKATSKYNYMSLDTLADAGDEATSNLHNVLLAASDNSLYIYRLGTERTIRLGKIDGLRGYVVSAKLIPAPNCQDPVAERRPLVAMIVHGPASTEESRSRPSSRQSDQSFDPSYPHEARTGTDSTKYRTTVEVYSLRDHRHVATLFATTSEAARIDNTFGKKSYEAPEPIGSLSVHATGEYVAVASTESGEIYLYDTKSGQTRQPFRCIGKTWTSVAPKKSRTWSSSSVAEAESTREGSPTRLRYEAPLLALHGRLLAYVPPVSSSRSTIFGTVKLLDTGAEIPGLTSHTPSSQPAATLQLDTPLDGSKVNEIARAATQEMLKGAKWVGDQGMQAWKSYWNPKSPELNAQYEQHFQQQFPPTHASDDPTRVTHQPTIVSFLDLEKLGNAQGHRSESALQPMNSFILPGGCSFLGLSPSGIGLFTASTKGDVQNVWDLMQLHYGPPVTVKNPLRKDQPAIIRQIARFTRVTTSRTVDVAWLGTRGTKIAVLTGRGTVHIHDLPASALSWPPRARLYAMSEPENDDASSIASTTATGWGSAFNAVSSGAQMLSSAVRSNPVARFSEFNFAQASAGAGAKGGKIVAAGFSRSVEAASGTVNSIMSIGETRLHVPSTTKMVLPGNMRWWVMKEGEAIAVVGDGVLRVTKVEMRKEHGKKSNKKYSVAGRLLTELNIFDPQTSGEYDPDLEYDGYDIDGEWVKAKRRRLRSDSRLGKSSFEMDTATAFESLAIDYDVDLEDAVEESWREDEPVTFGSRIDAEPFIAAAMHANNLVMAHNLKFVPNEEIGSLVDRIEEALPIESPPRVKTKKVKKLKGKAPVAEASPPSEQADSPYFLHRLESDDEDGPDMIMNL